VTQVQIHQAFLDRCITLLVHKLTTETASMIKYSAKICAARWWMNVCNYLRLWIYVGLSISRMYVDQPWFMLELMKL
jgi:acyl-CoA dehydrogenase